MPQSSNSTPGFLIAQAIGAIEATADGGATICGIAIDAEVTHLVICRAGQVAESACLDLGYNSVIRDDNQCITYISEGGETFLDAVAKRIAIGDRLVDEMQELLGELIAETIVNLVHRQKPPQVSLRLLASEPFSCWYHIDEYRVTQMPNSEQQSSQNAAGKDNLSAQILQGLAGACSDRHKPYRFIPNASLKTGK